MSGDDELLCALDQLTNAIYWYRRRGIDLTAAAAILEAVGDWLDEHDHTRNDSVPSVTADQAEFDDPLAEALDWLCRYVDKPAHDDRSRPTISEALTGWTAASAAEHNRSRPFDTTPRRSS